MDRSLSKRGLGMSGGGGEAADSLRGFLPAHLVLSVYLVFYLP